MAKYITECKLNYFDSKKAGKIAIVTMDNGQLYNIPNTWGTEALESLNKVLDIVEKDKDVKGWLLTGKPFIFNVGADIMSVDPNINEGRRPPDRHRGPQDLQADHGPQDPDAGGHQRRDHGRRLRSGPLPQLPHHLQEPGRLRPLCASRVLPGPRSRMGRNAARDKAGRSRRRPSSSSS